MKTNYYDLNGRFECDRRRKYDYDLKQSDNTVVLLNRLQKQLLLSGINGELETEDIADALHKGMEAIPFKSKKGKQLQETDIFNRILRAVNDFKYRQKNNHWSILTDLPSIDVKVPIAKEEVTISGISPDIVVTYTDPENILHVVSYMLKTGMPRHPDGTTYKEKDLENDKQAYALFLYSKEFALRKATNYAKVEISGGFIFLRKKTDKCKSISNPNSHFDEWLFTNDDGGPSDNIMCLSETIHIQPAAPTLSNMDILFKEHFNRFIDGISVDECTENQCKECELNEICHYNHAPISLEKEASSMPSIDTISLSTVQEKIESYSQGFSVVNAVPGAGKTLVLVLRIIELMNNGAKPEEIAIITFTNSGAEVFRERIALYNEAVGYGEDVSTMTATTFNGLGQQILEKEFTTFGFSRPPKVIDPIERYSIIADLLNKHDIPGLDYRNFTMDMPNAKGALAVGSLCFQAMKQNGWTRFDTDKLIQKYGRYCSLESAEALAELYDEYCFYLKEKNLVEYADQEVLVLEMLKKNPYYFDSFGWKHILVDEGQDTSENQFRLLKYMTQTSSFESCMVVGDDSQSIYGFRDTSPKFFMNFEDVMGLPVGTVDEFFMVENFRSTPEIINYANCIIDYNEQKVDKKIEAKNMSGRSVSVKGFFETSEEYEWIVESIKQKLDEGATPESIAYIAATRTELLKMADLLANENIPSVILIPEKYLENSRVRAGLSLAKFLLDPTASRDLLIFLNASLGGDLFSLTDSQVKDALCQKGEAVQKIRSLPEDSFRNNFFELLSSIDEDDEIFESFIDSLKYKSSMSEILDYCTDFELYGESAEKRRDHSYPGIVLTTAHSSKGMEWPIVFNSISKYDTADLHKGRTQKQKSELEEKRRLLFVSATRAKKELYITGKYIAFGGQKDPHFNLYLLQSANAIDSKIDEMAVLAEMKLRAAEKKKQREKEKLEKLIKDATKI